MLRFPRKGVLNLSKPCEEPGRAVPGQFSRDRRPDGWRGRPISPDGPRPAALRPRARGHARRDADRCPGCSRGPYSSERGLRTLVDGSSIAVIPASLFNTFPSLGPTATRLVVDLDHRVAVSNTGLRIASSFYAAPKRSASHVCRQKFAIAASALDGATCGKTSWQRIKS